MEYEELQFPEGLAGKTEYAHIFSESTNAGMEDKAKVSMSLRLSSLQLFILSLEGIRGERLDNNS